MDFRCSYLNSYLIKSPEIYILQRVVCRRRTKHSATVKTDPIVVGVVPPPPHRLRRHASLVNTCIKDEARTRRKIAGIPTLRRERRRDINPRFSAVKSSASDLETPKPVTAKPTPNEPATKASSAKRGPTDAPVTAEPTPTSPFTPQQKR